MMRALKLCSIGFVFLLLFSNCQATQAQMNTYEMGPYYVDGVGVTPNEAKADANWELYQYLDYIDSNLPPDHVLLDYEVIDEGFVDPTTYGIQFKVIIWDKTAPGPPMG